jgi:RimJ/RimL family protein N-acetyltransferase
MNIKLRKVRIEDNSYFAKWWRNPKIIALTSGNFAPISDEEISKSVASMAKNDLHWIIECDNQAIGHINLEKISSQQVELQISIGEEEYWSKGIGTKAIETILLKAKEKGFSTVRLEVRPTNSHAIHLYEKTGFKQINLKKYPDNSNLPEVLVFEKII